MTIILIAVSAILSNFALSNLVFIICKNRKNLKTEKIILGIDPGTMLMGYGLVLQKGKELHMICMGVIKLNKLDNQALKLKRIFERVLELVDEYHPDELAIEAPFFGKNVQSMLKLGRAQGVAMAAALFRDIPIFEYSPRKIKQSITGNGAASKEQVAAMVQKLCNFTEHPDYLDATDAMAAAVCHSFQNKLNIVEGGGESDLPKIPKGKRSVSGWADFLAKNPEKNVTK
ncbi:MAG: crossover junction endodeoxyribonuclease RuvC [bacterium]|nr:crossover junction endodeoxyribonuclease RuvC [Candidatus Limimorpha caballi]